MHTSEQNLPDYNLIVHFNLHGALHSLNYEFLMIFVLLLVDIAFCISIGYAVWVVYISYFIIARLCLLEK
jgi:hypothetical protein